MEYATFRKWLAEHGCRFDTQSEKRGESWDCDDPPRRADCGTAASRCEP